MEDGIIAIIGVHVLIALTLWMPRYFFGMRNEWCEASKRIPKAICGSVFGTLLIHEMLEIMEDRWDK